MDKKTLQDLRVSLDGCDQELYKLFQKRMEIIQDVAVLKKTQGLPIYDPERESEILVRYEGSGREFFQNLLRLSRYEQSLVLYPYNLVLIGFMGVGKTTVGHFLAQALGRKFVDLDQLLEKRFQMSISQLFARFGEKAFRTEESRLIEEVSKDRGLVIATGGGVILDPQNVEHLKKRGKLVLLTATPETLITRLSLDETRPLLGQEMKEEKVKELLEQRKSAYEQAADLSVCTDGKTYEEVAREIMSLLASSKDGQL